MLLPGNDFIHGMNETKKQKIFLQSYHTIPPYRQPSPMHMVNENEIDILKLQRQPTSICHCAAV